MDVLIIGSGGREHALAVGLSESNSVRNIHCCPGNYGTSQIGINHDIDITNIDLILNLSTKLDIDLVVVGPEAPLVAGLSDKLNQNGISCFGPNQECSRLEGSKLYAKNLMSKLKIPTGKFIEISEPSKIDDYLEMFKSPWVVKRDVLAGGKGVLVTENRDEAIDFIHSSIETDGMVLLEEFLSGEEASMLVLMDESGFVALPCSQDHKRVGEGDVGLNTGGMGAYAPAPIVTTEVQNAVISQIVEPMYSYLSSQEIPYRGCLYVGLMINSEGCPFVVEYNVRFGDPETQVTIPLISSDLCDLLLAVANGELSNSMPTFSDAHALTVVLAAEGYPGTPVKGRSITGDADTGWSMFSDGKSIIHHAGTGLVDGVLVSTGGRVLAGTGISGNSLKNARELAYNRLSEVQLEGSFFRRDIGHKVLEN